MGRFSLKDLGQRVSLQGARDYLVRHGWHLSDEEDRVVCAGPLDDGGRPIVRILPPSESYADYDLRLEDLIATLSMLEDRPAVEVAAEMARGAGTGPAPSGSWADRLIDEHFQRGVQIIPGRDPEESLQELRSLLRGVELEVYQKFGNPLQAVALMAVRLARLVRSGDASTLFLGEVCECALAAGGLAVRLLPQDVYDLLNIAAVDDPSEPEGVLDWLIARTRSAGETGRQPSEPPSAEGVRQDQADSRGFVE